MDDNSEAKFIHAISNPIGVAFGMVECVFDTLKASDKAGPKELERLAKALKSLNKVTDLIQVRREELITRSKKTETSA